MNREDLKPNAIVRIMDFVGVIILVEEIPKGLFVVVDSPKRIALHQTTLDNLIYETNPQVWSLATPIELIQEVERWFNILCKEKTNG